MAAAVTGLGVVSALGNDVETFWRRLIGGGTGIGPLTATGVSNLKFSNAAEVKEFEATDWMEAKEAAILDRFACFGYAAARQAVDDAGLVLPSETAIITGCATGGMQTRDQNYSDLYGEKKQRFHPMSIPRVMESATASLLSMKFQVRGPVFNITSACASSNHAIAQALAFIESGRVKVALVGGSEAMLVPSMLRAWEAVRVVAPDTCRPFSKDRLGMILGEGAGMLVLEDLAYARARGARIHAVVAGAAMNADASHWTQPDAENARQAMVNAGVPLEDVGYVNAHGTGTPLNDPTEAQAIAKAFGERRPAVSSTKGAHGHALGASGALEAVVTVLALERGLLPPVANFTEIDPACAMIDLITTARESRVKAALSNSFAFGGLNCVVAFRSPDSL